MKLLISFEVYIPNKSVSKAIEQVGLNDVMNHAYDYTTETLNQAFHKPNVQEVSNVSLNIEYDWRER